MDIADIRGPALYELEGFGFSLTVRVVGKCYVAIRTWSDGGDAVYSKIFSSERIPEPYLSELRKKTPAWGIPDKRQFLGLEATVSAGEDLPKAIEGSFCEPFNNHFFLGAPDALLGTWVRKFNHQALWFVHWHAKGRVPDSRHPDERAEPPIMSRELVAIVDGYRALLASGAAAELGTQAGQHLVIVTPTGGDRHEIGTLRHLAEFLSDQGLIAS